MRYSAGQDLQDQSVSIVYLHIFIRIDKGDENVDVAVHLLGHPLCVPGQGTIVGKSVHALGGCGGLSMKGVFDFCHRLFYDLSQSACLTQIKNCSFSVSVEFRILEALDISSPWG